jgi:protein-disulfide isomerase
MNKAFLFVSVMAVALTGCKTKGDENSTNSTASNVAAPAGQNWNETVAATPVGGYVKGNPNAIVKLVEYGALSCPVCKAFSDDSKEKLKTYVGRGTLSVEFRPFMVHPQDLPGTLLAACNGPAPFFMISEKMYDNQNEWAYGNPLSNELIAEWSKGGPTSVATQMATHLGLNDFVSKLGVSQEKAKACLADKGAIDRLEALQKQGMQEKVTGTPTFFINGQKVENVVNWADLEPLLVKAGA